MFIMAIIYDDEYLGESKITGLGDWWNLFSCWDDHSPPSYAISETGNYKTMYMIAIF